jgi:predicted alpha/beta-hydrolase family hydrolase
MRTRSVDWRVAVAADEIAAAYEPAVGTQRGVFVCAHGAGGHMNDRGLINAAQALRAAGLGVVRFNFVYREKKSSRPDPMPRLKACISAVVERAREELDPATLIIGGRSMGGRAASMLAAEGFAADGLLLLAYPLHPAGQPEKLRDEHLPSITMPALCFNGTRDPLCRTDLMDAALRKVKTSWTMHWLEGADHSFHVPKSSGRSDADVLLEVSAVTGTWLDRLAR